MAWADPAHCRIVWQLSLLIHSTLESVTTIMTLLNHFLIKTVCGLCVPSCSSTVRCVPSVLGWAPTTAATRTFRSTWFSSAPLRNYAYRLLESWNRKEFTGYTSPHLFPLFTSEGLRFLSEAHSMLSGRKCNLHYSTQVQQPAEGRFWVRLCRWCRP